MSETTKQPWGYVHHKGLDQHLVGATLENVAIVEDRHGNAKENAEFIVKAVNSHDALVVALEAVIEASSTAAQNWSPYPTDSKYLPKVIQLAKEALEQVK